MNVPDIITGKLMSVKKKGCVEGNIKPIVGRIGAKFKQCISSRVAIVTCTIVTVSIITRVAHHLGEPMHDFFNTRGMFRRIL